MICPSPGIRYFSPIMYVSVGFSVLLYQRYFAASTSRNFQGIELMTHVNPLYFRQVVRAQYHPGAKGGTGNWLVEPTLRMEYIGRLGTKGGRPQEGPRENGTPAQGVHTAGAIAPAGTPMEP